MDPHDATRLAALAQWLEGFDPKKPTQLNHLVAASKLIHDIINRDQHGLIAKINRDGTEAVRATITDAIVRSHQLIDELAGLHLLSLAIIQALDTVQRDREAHAPAPPEKPPTHQTEQPA